MKQRTEVIAQLLIGRTTFGSICQIMFWLHQAVVGLPCLVWALEIFMKGTAQGLLPIAAMMLFWIGGTIVLGIGSILGSEVNIVRYWDEPPPAN